jgi:oxygen-independent coproporphyrinogen-3 oxidase
LGEWEDAVGAGALPATDVERLTPEQRMGELAMLQLRLTRGLDLADFAARTGCDVRSVFSDVLDRLAPAGLLEVTPEAIRLCGRGLDVADAIAAEFLAEATTAATAVGRP